MDIDALAQRTVARIERSAPPGAVLMVAKLFQERPFPASLREVLAAMVQSCRGTHADDLRLVIGMSDDQILALGKAMQEAANGR